MAQAIVARVQNGVLTITVNMAQAQKAARPSSSGKTQLWASLSEKLEGYDNVRFGFNLYQKA